MSTRNTTPIPVCTEELVPTESRRGRLVTTVRVQSIHKVWSLEGVRLRHCPSIQCEKGMIGTSYSVRSEGVTGCLGV